MTRQLWTDDLWLLVWAETRTTDLILQEDGSAILLECGNYILLEA